MDPVQTTATAAGVTGSPTTAASETPKKEEAKTPSGGGGEGKGSGSFFKNMVSAEEIGFSLGIIAIIVALLLPMPKWLLDISLALSITLSLLILMTVLFLEDPLELSSFPTILLVSTMLRLSLNVASTRLILTHGETGVGAAGEVIKAFGGFIMGNNYLIGLIVFIILVIVNFVVITKGSGRIAEVSARFTLDAMPGKQMAIDADLSAGLIDEEEAKKRRKKLEYESSFYGSMDGAAKFVRGDAVAGLMITFINIVGGIIIGVAQKGITLSQAAQSYTFLTVGDGLVTQIPALIVSIAAGMLVTKSGVGEIKEGTVVKQLSNQSTALWLCSILMAGMALLPAVPMLPFMILSILSGYIAFQVGREKKKPRTPAAAKTTKTQQTAKAEQNAEEAVKTSLEMDEIRLELGYALLPLISSDKGNQLTEQVQGLRRQLAREMGFILPSVRIQDNMKLGYNDYAIYIKEILAAKGSLYPNMYLAMDPSGNKIDMEGELTKEPAFGIPAIWIEEKNKAEAQNKGYTIVDCLTVITTHMTEIVKENIPDLLTYTETEKLFEGLDASHKKLLETLVPNQVSVGTIQRVLQNLLTERISVRDLPTILEGVSEVVGYTRNITLITEHVRTCLARQISNALTNEKGVLSLVTLSPVWEQSFNESIVGEGDKQQLAMPPAKLQEFTEKVRKIFDAYVTVEELPCLLTTPKIRPYVRSIIERFRSQIPVISQNEIHPKVRLKTVGQIT